MSKVKINIGGTEHEIEAAPITLIYKSPKITQDLQYKGHVKLDAQASLAHLESINVLHPETQKFVMVVFPDYRSSWDLDWICSNEGSGFKHVTGRIDFTLHAQDKNVPIVWVYPETSLHPTSQLNLTDALIMLTARGQGKDVNFDQIRKMEREPKWP